MMWLQFGTTVRQIISSFHAVSHTFYFNVTKIPTVLKTCCFNIGESPIQNQVCSLLGCFQQHRHYWITPEITGRQWCLSWKHIFSPFITSLGKWMPSLLTYVRDKKIKTSFQETMSAKQISLNFWTSVYLWTYWNKQTIWNLGGHSGKTAVHGLGDRVNTISLLLSCTFSYEMKE